MDSGEKAEVKLTILEGLKEYSQHHYDTHHRDLEKTVEKHSKYFWWAQGAWAAVLAWFNFGDQ